MISTRLWLGAMCAIALATSAVWASTRSVTRPNRLPALSAQAIEAKALRWQSLQVEAAEATAQLWSDAFAGLLKLDESKVARVGAPLSGRVVRVYADVGYVVKQGDPLFSVASPDVSGLAAERRQAALALEIAEAALSRVEALVTARALPERELADAASRKRQAELSVEVARIKQNSLDVQLDSPTQFTVRAPRAGRIVEKQLLVGQQLTARGERTLLTIADLSSLWLTTDLFEADLRGIARGAEVKVTLPALPDLIIHGEVDAISALVDPERRSVPVRVRLDNVDGKLKVNMFAQARFHTSPPMGTVSVGAGAVRSDGSREYVYVRTGDGEFERRWVTSGSVVAGRALIHEGVAAGDEVAVRGMALLDNRLAMLR